MKKIIILLFIAVHFNVCGQILPYNAFRTPAQVDAAITQLANRYPTLTRIQTIGNSLEGRPMKVLKISKDPGVDNPTKGDVVYMSLIHAREWITVETLLYIADRMLAEYSTNAQVRADIDRAQIWIIPIANPDGYAYTHSTYRYWRKNRRNNGDGTFGVDLNRNWGYQWGLASGSSGTTSDDVYRGTAPFSEPENVVIRNFVNSRANLKCFVSYHSYSELYLRPWSYTTSDPPGEPTLRSIVQRNIGLIQSVHGHVYSENIWYTSSGETTDYMWQTHRVAAFTPELRPTQYGVGGFAPPPTEILPCAQENYPAAMALIHDAARTGLYIRDHGSDTGQEPSAIWTGTNWSTPFWVSPDIWTVPAVLNQNATVDLNVRVNNNTGALQQNVTVEVYYTDPRISLEFPNPSAVLIGTQTFNVPPGGTTRTFRWTTPTGRNSWGELHWCVGAVVKHANDMPLTTLVEKSSNVSCKNFHTTTVVEATTLTFAAYNFLNVAAEIHYNVNKETLTQGWEANVSDKISKRTGKPTESSIRKAKLLKSKGVIIEPGETIYFTVDVKSGGTVPKGSKGILEINGALVPLVAGKREAVGNGFTYEVVAK